MKPKYEKAVSKTYETREGKKEVKEDGRKKKNIRN